VLRAGCTEGVTSQLLREHVAQYAENGLIAKYAVLDTIRLIDAIPRTSVGKVDKKALRQICTS
jgi:fatty-acyl-CoA synthase